ncbi:SusC/RagA family TonB-linked outer membrane protein [Niabella ginsengisoli]|uniref:SusC/RagA family TonB-linked outer membrane protein n=1 Tax=Niabella ginsengisoli TaxID=522298 RepID=A0ABS9SDP8_9BACT|nr:SusC/RagA family TonB-linked outer membrane protein [Niabella ginsengisoli]MCH5596478.1 SusC/RagA family TonB-linked outer membrane protein [Niabella ginsengisoli]
MLRFNSNYRRVVVFFISLLLYNISAAQNNQLLKGKVVDEFGHGLQGVEVREEATGQNVLSNENGAFEIQAATNATLIFSGKGFDVAYYHAKIGDKNISIQLRKKFLVQTDSVDLLYDQKKLDLSVGAISTVYTSQLATTPATLYAYALPGRLPGLYTQQTQGFRSFSATNEANSVSDLAGTLARTGLNAFSDNNEIGLRLRGQAPVIVVDGIQRNIFSLDPESIESISVLKDGMSSIALGQRSSRGVMLVTTKKPQLGPPQLSFSAQVGIQEPMKLPKPVSAFDYAYLVNEALQNEGRKTVYNVSDLEAFKRGDNPYRYPDVNWYDKVMKERRAPLYRYNLNLGGGGNVARYMVSLNYMNQEGLLNTSNPDATLQLQRYLINSKVEIDVTKYFQVGVQLFGRIQDGNQPGATVSSILENLLRTPNNGYPIYNPDGSFGGNNSFQTNLKASLDNSGYMMNNDRDIMANLDLKYNFDAWLKGLWAKFNGNLSVQSATLTDRSLRVPVFQMQVGADESDITYARYGNANAQANNFYAISNARYWYAQGQVGYSKSLPTGHSFTGYLMADMRRSTLNFDLPGTATNYMLKGEYNYLEKYILEAAANYSGYDRYPPGKQYGMFYSAGAGWNIAKENFIKDNVSWLNQLKLRATYAHTGNGVDNSGYFIWRQSYSQNNDQTGISGIDHIRAQIAMVENGLANSTISWEEGNKFNVGLDIGLFKNHLVINADFYRDMYFNLLQVRGGNIELLGTAYPAENIGKNLYTGSELLVTYQNNIRSFNYYVTANASLEQSKALFMDEQMREYSWNERTGVPVGQRFGYIADGFFQTEEEVANSAIIAGYEVAPGDIKYRDLNNDGVIDQFDLTAIGSTKPLLYYGLTTGFNYKGVGFSILFQGVKNRNLYIDSWDTEILRANGQVYGQMYEQLLNRWTPETAATATYPRLKANGGFGDAYTLSSSTFWMHSGDYWRIKNINLQYTFPYKWTSRFKVAGLTAFANAQNLFTWSAYDRVDPEVGYGAYPIQRVYNIGINVKF